MSLRSIPEDLSETLWASGDQVISDLLRFARSQPLRKRGMEGKLAQRFDLHWNGQAADIRNVGMLGLAVESWESSRAV